MESKVVRLDYSLETLSMDRATYEGTLTYAGKSLSFSGFDWEGVLESVSDALKESVGGHLVMKRKEAPYPMTLPEGIEELLRTDLPAAIAALTVAPQTIIIEAPREKVSYGLRHGNDTLADALGEEVYLSVQERRRIQVEDPTTGRWEVVEGLDGGPRPLGKLDLFQLTWSRSRPMMGWVKVLTKQLLSLNLARYYLPRRWNPSGGWITHDDLVNMYETYKKEKSNAAIE